jgi:hypothetical protein
LAVEALYFRFSKSTNSVANWDKSLILRFLRTNMHLIPFYFSYTSYLLRGMKSPLCGSTNLKTKQEVMGMGKRNLWELSAIASICVMLAACGGGSSSGGDASTGSLSVSVTDAPAPDDATVCLHFTGITLHHSDGDRISIPFDPSTYVDATFTCVDNVPSDAPPPDDPANNAVNLSSLQGVLNVALADSIEVKAGSYNWIRLDVDESLSYVMDSSGQNDLSCPSCDGEQSGLKLNRGITVPAGGEADFMIDIDLAKSLNKKPSGNYQLRPTLRLVNLVETGKITGVVDVSLITNAVNGSETGCSVYVYAGPGVIPDDYYYPEDDPVLTSTKVVFDMDSGLFKYTAAYLQTDSGGDPTPTPYTVALTCDDDDSVVNQNNDPSALNGMDVIFTDGNVDGVGQNANVSTGQTKVINFPP